MRLAALTFALACAAAAQTPQKAPQSASRMEIALERLQNGQWVTIDPALVLDQGDRVRFRFRANFSGYLYVMNQSSSGTYEQLFPREETGRENRVEAGKDYNVPSTSTVFRIAGPAGHEVVYWLVTPAKLTDAPPRYGAPPTGTPVKPPTLIPRCDDAVMRARNSCVDSSAGPRLVPRGVDMPKNIPAAAAKNAPGLLFIRQKDTSVIASPEPLGGPVVYEIQARPQVGTMKPTQIALLLALAAAAGAQQQQRDLKLEKIEEPAPAKKVSIPRSYAVVVGISRYQNLPENLQLKFAERDAQAVFSVLISPEGGNFKAENVRVLTGAKATLAGLRKEVNDWLPGVAKDGDRVLIYFAGHGFIVQGKGYLAPYDFDMNRANATGFPMDELGLAIGSKIRASYKILLTDACHSGAITPEDTQSLNRTLADLNKSLFSLTASRDRERSFESPDLEGGHGVFTHYLVRGLGGAADTSGDGVVTADELAEYVHTQVREATGGQQNPTSDRGSFDPEMLLSYVPSNAKAAEAPAPKFGSLVFEVNTDGVEVFLDGKSIGVVPKGKPFAVPGLPPGQHTVKGVKMGYEPDGPRQETVYPGQESTVSIKILIARRRQKAAVDEFDKGMEFYQKGFEQNYKKAVEHFQKAAAADSTYSQAFFYLGLTYNALFDQEQAGKAFKQAVGIDPDYLEARANYAGMLLDVGDVDEALRQVNAVLQRKPDHAMALTAQAQAYRLKEAYPEAVESARKAIRAAPGGAEPHLWLADSLRLSGKFAEAKPEYDSYLRLSNFNSKLAGQLNYYVLGFLVGLGKRKHASQQDIWQDLRSLAYFGLCDCDRKLNAFDSAIANCQRSLSYDSQDPYAHYALGLSYMRRGAGTGNLSDLAAAEQQLRQVVALNPDLTESKYARQNIENIQKALQAR